MEERLAIAGAGVYAAFSNVRQVGGVNPCDTLREKLKGHSELVCTEVPGGIRIEPPRAGNFAVEVHGDDAEWIVYLGDAGFHESFDSGEETLSFVAWCYSGDARVRDVWRGSSPSKASLESREDTGWQWISTTRFLFVPFWRKRREVILENPNLLKA